MVAAMLLRRTAPVFLSLLLVASAEEALPPVAEGVSASIQKLPEPEVASFPGGLELAVTTGSEPAQAHTVLGLDYLHGGWEFEAGRHFTAALKADPECLLAQWGLVASMLARTPENAEAREAAAGRLLTLVERGAGSELERGYAYGLIQYFKEGPVGAATAFRKVAAKFPNDVQAAIFAALFGRGGYDADGEATPDQVKSEKSLEELLAKNPGSTLLRYALLTIRAEAPDLASSLELARELDRLAPEYPPYAHLLGHYEWRCGHHERAEAAFAKAAAGYEAWMARTGVSALECPGWVMAESYHAVALASLGKFDAALELANRLRATRGPVDRAGSPGGRLLLWEASVLPARLYLWRGEKGDAGRALAVLPETKDIASYRVKSAANWYVDGLRLYLEAVRLLDEGKLPQAQAVAAVLAQHGEKMAAAQPTAAETGERAEFARGFRTLEVLASEVRGRIAMAGPKAAKGSAYNWFRAAADRQVRPPMMLPPALLTPMEARLGDFLADAGKPAEAAGCYEVALKKFPNDPILLQKLAAARKQAGE